MAAAHHRAREPSRRPDRCALFQEALRENMLFFADIYGVPRAEQRHHTGDRQHPRGGHERPHGEVPPLAHAGGPQVHGALPFRWCRDAGRMAISSG